MNGGVLYKDFGDIKPPGIFLIYFVLGKLFGFSNFLISIKLFIIIFQTLTSFCYYKIGRLFSDKKNSVGLGIVFLIAISIKWEFWASNIMLLVLLPISVAIYLVLKDNIRLQKHVAFLFGFTISVSTIISTNAIFYSLLLPIMSFIKYRKIKRVMTDTLISISGFIVPIGFVCLYFYLNDALFDWYWWNFNWAFIYTNVSILGKIRSFITTIVIVWEWIPLYFIFIIGLIKVSKLTSIKIDMKIFFFITIFISILSRITLSKSVPRYNLYILPGIILFIPIFFQFMKKYLKVILIVFTFSAFSYNNIDQILRPYDRKYKARNELHEWIKLNSDKSDKIFIWYEGYEIYYYSKRDMATSFFSPANHLVPVRLWEKNQYKYIDVPWDKFLSEFHRDSPMLVIDLSNNFEARSGQKINRNGEGRELLNYVNTFKTTISEQYTKVKTIDNIKIWKKNN